MEAATRTSNMKKIFKFITTAFLLFLVLFLYLDLNAAPETQQPQTVQTGISEQGTYTSKEDVALYIHTFGKLPSNFVTKSKARDMGWIETEGNLQKVCEGCSIGGDNFGNREKALPRKSGRKYYECDIDYQGGRRNEKRIVYSNDGLIYYTGDHYNTFELLYGEP